MAKIFISYSHLDETFKAQFTQHLKSLERTGEIEVWHDRQLMGGDDFAGKIDANLSQADVVLLLVSANFIASDYCHEVEMRTALERHEKGQTVVVPVILDFCNWHSSPFGHLTAIPPDGREITRFPNFNEGFNLVVRELSRLVKEINSRHSVTPTPSLAVEASTIIEDKPRSVNLTLKRDFTDHDKYEFAKLGFEYISRYFKNSLEELPGRNPGVVIKTDFDPDGSQSFYSAIFIEGKLKADCTISRKTSFGNIGFTWGKNRDGNTLNDALTVYVKNGALSFKPTLFNHFSTSNVSEELNYQGAAELYWTMFIQRLQ
jgi:hypothetical protein